MTYFVRPPTVGDADDLGAVHVRAWQAGYRGGLMPDEYLDALSASDRAASWHRGLDAGLRPRHHRFVAVGADGRVVGFIVVGPADGRDDAAFGEVFSLNVDPDHWESGAGSTLLVAGTAALAAEGFDSAVLWVHRDNERAKRFYENREWRADGAEREVEIFDVAVPELRYVRSL